MSTKNKLKAKPAPYNPRKISDKEIKKLAGNLKELGDLSGIVHDENTGHIISGNQRSKIIDLNNSEIIISDEYDKPTKTGTTAIGHVIWEGEKYNYRRVNWTPEQCRKANITANKLGGHFDFDLLAEEFEIPDLKDWGFTEKELEGIWDDDIVLGWNPEKTEDAELGDGINELVGYGLQSFWKDIRNENCPVHNFWIDLPVQKTTNLVRQKYSRTNLEEIQRIVKTYMREGDYFLESCVGWATFSSVAKFFGFSGVGTYIWDTSLEHSKKQLAKIKTDAKVDIKYGNALDLPFEKNEFDFLYCNPPFMDQEKYSGSKDDIATGDKEEFKNKFYKLMSENYRVLKPGCLCVITINDMREEGYLLPLHSNVINWGEEAGFRLWDFVVAEVQSQKIRLRKKDYEKRRTVKCHEYVIVFKKPE